MVWLHVRRVWTGDTTLVRFKPQMPESLSFTSEMAKDLILQMWSWEFLSAFWSVRLSFQRDVGKLNVRLLALVFFLSLLKLLLNLHCYSYCSFWCSWYFYWSCTMHCTGFPRWNAFLGNSKWPLIHVTGKGSLNPWTTRVMRSPSAGEKMRTLYYATRHLMVRSDDRVPLCQSWWEKQEKGTLNPSFKPLDPGVFMAWPANLE